MGPRPTRPSALQVNGSHIPEELKALGQWVLWRYDWRPDSAKPGGGHWAKVPYSPQTRRLAAVDRPETWARFEQAMAAYTVGGWAGIGFVFTSADPYAGIDLDKVREPATGAVDPDSLRIVYVLDSYSELSTSGRGLHVIVRATLPPGGRRKGSLEIYDRGRYFAMTGHHVEATPATVEERNDELAALHARIFADSAPASTPGEAPASSVDLEDAPLLERARRAKNGVRFTALFDHGTAEGDDHSRLDLELCSALAFWAGRDAAQMDRLFRQSALMRAKWDERRGATTYGAMTINEAIAGCASVYSPLRAPHAAATSGRPSPPPSAEPDAPPAYWTLPALADAYVLAARAPHHRLRFGYPELDAYLRGIAPGEVAAVLARSGVGKTAFALNLIDHMTVRAGLPTLMFSLEMPGIGVFERLTSITKGWVGERVEERVRGEDPETMRALLEICERWQSLRLVDRACSLDELDALVDGARRQWSAPLRLVVVDYAGLVSLRRATSAYDRASTVAVELKNLAKRHGVALLVLYQLSRAGGSGGEAVTLSMARDSGVIEEAADYCLGVWRPELADDLDDGERAEVVGQFRVRILKNRNRELPEKPAVLSFNGGTMTIESPSEPRRRERR